MRKANNIGPIRITDEDKETLEAAAAKSDVLLSAKIRELALIWARKALK